jgi:peptidoglycan/xylan/chitin deacetylase (PgdA/CDA1 family)
MTAAQLRELGHCDFEIGCHSMTHPVLSDLDDAGVKREVADAKEMLEQAIGKPVEHFSCPGGRYDSRTMQVAKRAGYRTVANSVPRVNSASTDPFCLGRVAIMRGLSKPAFQKLCRGETLWRLGLQASLRDRAKRLLGTAAYDRLRGALLRR